MVNIRSQARRHVKTALYIKPINLVKPQYRRLKQASIIKATSSQIIEASLF